MGRKISTDITGNKYGRLTVISRCEHNKRKWICVCECGNKVIADISNLRYGSVKSCGCLRKELGKKSLLKITTKHGLHGHRLYSIWEGMKTRCYNKNAYGYEWYGARGIIVCDKWRDDFQAFYDWALANGYKDGLTIDRIDVNGNYEPENCQWLTRGENTKKRFQDKRK